MTHPNLSDHINHDLLESERLGGIRIEDLPLGAIVEVQTRNTLYTIKKEGESTYTIQGHPTYCPSPKRVRIAGSTWGGSMLKVGFIGVGMRLELVLPHFGTVHTSTISSVTVKRHD